MPTRRFTQTVGFMEKMAARRVKEWENEAKKLRKSRPELSKFAAEDIVLHSIHMALQSMYAMGVR